jgi:hypothetical protein
VSKLFLGGAVQILPKLAAPREGLIWPGIEDSDEKHYSGDTSLQFGSTTQGPPNIKRGPVSILRRFMRITNCCKILEVLRHIGKVVEAPPLAIC